MTPKKGFLLSSTFRDLKSPLASVLWVCNFGAVCSSPGYFPDSTQIWIKTLENPMGNRRGNALGYNPYDAAWYAQATAWRPLAQCFDSG